MVSKRSSANAATEDAARSSASGATEHAAWNGALARMCWALVEATRKHGNWLSICQGGVGVWRLPIKKCSEITGQPEKTIFDCIGRLQAQSRTSVLQIMREHHPDLSDTGAPKWVETLYVESSPDSDDEDEAMWSAALDSGCCNKRRKVLVHQSV